MGWIHLSVDTHQQSEGINPNIWFHIFCKGPCTVRGTQSGSYPGGESRGCLFTTLCCGSGTQRLVGGSADRCLVRVFEVFSTESILDWFHHNSSRYPTHLSNLWVESHFFKYWVFNCVKSLIFSNWVQLVQRTIFKKFEFSWLYSIFFLKNWVLPVETKCFFEFNLRKPDFGEKVGSSRLNSKQKVQNNWTGTWRTKKNWFQAVELTFVTDLVWVGWTQFSEKIDS